MKKCILMAAFICTSVLVIAQENRNEKNEILRGPYETNRFFDNWFVGFGGGVNIYEGESDNKISFRERLAPALDISLGKWITPEYGVRLQYSGLKAKGLSGYKSDYAKEPKGGQYKEEFGVVNLHGDFMWNLSNAIGGYKESRIWSISPYVGLGWARSYKNGIHTNEFAPSVGIYNSFRISSVVDLTLEARQMIVDQRFDGTTGGCRWEGMSSLTVGLSFKLGKRNFKRVKPADYSVYTKRIQTLESNNAEMTSMNEKLERENDELRNRKPDVVAGANTITASPVALFFGLGKSTLDKKELVNLDFYVRNAIKTDSKKVFTLIGSADSATGNKDLNQQLSEKRMQFVYNLLISQYGISPERLIKKAEGDQKNRFNDPELNRTVILE